MRTFPARTSEPLPPPTGLTLAEMVVVVLVMGLMAMMALPAFHNMILGTLDKEVNRLSGIIQMMRNEAVLSNLRYRLVIDLEMASYAVEREVRETPGEYAELTDPSELRPHNLPKGLEIEDFLVLGKRDQRLVEGKVPILIDNSGFVDPFILHFKFAEEEYTLRIRDFTSGLELLEGYHDE